MARSFRNPDLARAQSKESFPNSGHENRVRVDRGVGAKFDQVRLQENSLTSYINLVLNQNLPNYCCQID